MPHVRSHPVCRAVCGLTLLGGACSVGRDSDPWTVPQNVSQGDGGEVGGSTGPELEPDEREPVRAAGVPPISGGTLLLLRDGDTAVVSDPDRDLIHVAALDDATSVATIELEPGDEPGRAAQDDDGLVHVALRGAGELLTIDPRLGTMVARHPTCANPRGVAHDGAQVLVACAGGEVVFHPPGEPSTRRVEVASDLRDILVVDGAIRVSRFRSADLLTIDGDGLLLATERPPEVPGTRVASTAWRTVLAGDDGWLMVHQTASTSPIDLAAEQAAYGGGSECDVPVLSQVSLKTSGELRTSGALGRAALAVDAALSPDGSRIAVAAAGELDVESTNQSRVVLLLDTDTLAAQPGECVDPMPVPVELPGHAVAVAFADDSRLVVHSREPAALFVVSLVGGAIETIALEGESRLDTGHELFHQDAGLGLACASCHPEGGDDGRVWTFFAPGPVSRRTQPMNVGLGGTEPFHWSGDQADFASLAAEVHGNRMGGRPQSASRLAAFEDWLFDLTPPNPERVPDTLSERGAEAFVTWGCASCHADQAVQAGKAVMIGGELLQAPPLRGVALRAPYMHDGGHADLAGAVRSMVDVIEQQGTPTDDDLAAIVAYLETL